jgi:hypothetical protein
MGRKGDGRGELSKGGVWWSSSSGGVSEAGQRNRQTLSYAAVVCLL